MAFRFARVFTPDRDGINGYENIYLADGTLVAIRLRGELVDDEIGQSLVTTLEITGPTLAGLPPSNPVTADTPADPRYQAIADHVLREVKRLHAEWRVTQLAGRADQATAGQVTEPMPVKIANALPLITPALLATVS